MAAHDGSINISTKLDVSGLNQGTKQINRSVEKNIARPMQNLTKSLGGILRVIKSIGAALIASFVGGAIINGIRSIVQEFDLLTGTSGDKFKALSGALDTLKGSFVNLIVQALVPAIPYLIDFAQWLTRIVQDATQLVAALFGFDKTVGNIMTKAASGAKKAAKEARGALAAFDQINLLQQKQEPETPEGPTATPGPMGISEKMKELADNILHRLKTIADIFKTLFDNPLAVLNLIQNTWRAFVEWVRNNLPFGGVIADVLTVIGDTFKKMIINIIETFLKVKENILRIFQGIGDFLTGVFTGNWALAWEGLKNIVAGVFGALAALVEGILNHIGIALGGMAQILQVALAPVIEFLGAMFDRIKDKIGDAIEAVKAKFTDLAKWFLENVFSPVASGFGSMLTDIKQGFVSTFNGLKDFVRGTINSIIDFLNRMIDGVVNGINAVIGSANAIAGLAGLPEISPVTAVKIPRLATGAVIPPNSEFLAVLGDQHNGKNIEAPAAMFEEMLRRAVESAGGGDITVTVPVYLDNEKIYQGQQRVSKRHGASLVKSGVTR